MNAMLMLCRLVISLPALGQNRPSPETILGEWLAPGKDSRILIFQKGDRYFGRITWGTGGPATDEKNPDPALRKRELIGLVILSDFRQDGAGTWTDGTIYDPREGKTYACKMTLRNPNSLNIRGYVGVSLFGRTEVWTRYTN